MSLGRPNDARERQTTPFGSRLTSPKIQPIAPITAAGRRYAALRITRSHPRGNHPSRAGSGTASGRAAGAFSAALHPESAQDHYITTTHKYLRALALDEVAAKVEASRLAASLSRK